MERIPLDERIKRAYCKQFGLASYKKYIEAAFDSQEADTWKARISLWAHLYFLQAVMFYSMMNNHTKGAHPPPSVVAKGAFQLDSQAAKRFHAGRILFPVLIRHTYSQMNHIHPLSKSVKSMAVQIGSWFDCTLLSGHACPFFNTETFQAFLTMQKDMIQGKSILPLLEQHPSLWNSALSIQPQGSHSYLDLQYSTMMPYDEKGTNKLIKFLVVAKDSSLVPEKQVMDFPVSEKQVMDFPKSIWHSESDAKQSFTIYEDDYKTRLDQHPIEYEMFYQEEMDTRTNRNAAFPWQSQWIPFGKLVIHDILPDSGNTTFDINKMPDTLFLPDATSCSDPKVIGHIRKVIYPSLQSIRKHCLSLGVFPSLG